MSLQNVHRQASTESIWILGGGQFGCHAASMLHKNSPDADITLVEKERLAEPPEHVTCVHEDGVAWLTRYLTADTNVTKIVPALPLHLAAEWLKHVFSEQDIPWQQVDVPDELLRKLPHPIRQSSSQAVISHADFICPSHCRKPEDICTHTGKQRPRSLYTIIEDIEHNRFKPLVIQSRQFAQGVGGFFPEDLWKLYTNVISIPKTPLLIGTACKCHGIVDGLIIGQNV